MKDFKKMSQKFISIVIPIRNEERNIQPLFKEIKEVMEGLNTRIEVIFVEDGSTDNSQIVLGKLYDKEKDIVKVVMFKRGFGKAAAISAGFEIAKGSLIFTMDGDLQDAPKEIPRFLAKLDEGYDLISGWKYERKDPLSKKIASKIFNFVTSLITGVKLHDFNCGFKVYRKEVIKHISIYGDLHRYIPVFAHQEGYKVGEVKINHRPRIWGKSKYGSSRLLGGFLDLLTVIFLTRFIRKPLHFFDCIGLFMAFLGFTADIYLTILKLMGEGIGNRPLLLFGNLLIIVGIQFILMGLIGEMMSKIFQGQSREYSVKRYLGIKGGEWTSEEERMKRGKL